MGKPFNIKSTFSLLKTNPRVTGNVKLVVDSKGDIFMETFDNIPELNRSKYKGIKLNVNNSWENDVFSLVKNNNIPLNTFFKDLNENDFKSVKSDFSKQYNTEYQQGVFLKKSNIYKEQLSYFVPTYFEKGDIPEYFAIIKVPNPVSINSKEGSTNNNTSIENNIYNANYKDFEGNTTGYSDSESNYFFETILKDCDIFKVYDLTENSNIGKYLRTYLNNNNLPQSPFSINWNKGTNSTVNGISLRNGGFSKESFDLFTEAFSVDRSVLQFDELLTNKFSDLGIVNANIINLEFLFDDENDADFTINRYFGIYFNREDISKFKLNPEDFNLKSSQNPTQQPFIKDVFSLDKKTNLEISNINGVKLFANFFNNYKIQYTDVNNKNYIPYIISTTNKIFKVNNNTTWNEDEIVLHNKSIRLQDFIGFNPVSSGIIKSSFTNTSGRSYFTLELLGVLDSLEVRLRSVDENLFDFDINSIFVGSNSLEKGTFSSNVFSLNGNTLDILNSLSKAINNYSDINEDLNLYSVVLNNKLIVFTRGKNEYWNNYNFLVFSNTTNSKNLIKINSKQDSLNVPNNFNTYNKIIDPLYNEIYNANIFYYVSNFKGGNNNELTRVRIRKEDLIFFNTEKYLKTNNWFTKITSIDEYLDEPVFYNGRIVNFTGFGDYYSISTLEQPFISNGNFIYIHDLGFNTVGLMSINPVRYFDTDTFISDYGKKADSLVSLTDVNFKTIAGIIDEETGDIPYITNEYDRLNENEIGELAFKSKIVPNINKFVINDYGIDVRENNYRLTNNSAFSFDNFSPSFFEKLPNPKYYTHEWYYLDKYPNNFSIQNREESFSYFNNSIDINELKRLDIDYFTNYFTQYFVQKENDIKHIPTRFKYSLVDYGDLNSFSSTFFRGVKVQIRKRIENTTDLNFNYNQIPVTKDINYNGYKFSCVLKNEQGKFGYDIIENKKFKNITFVIYSDFYTYIDDTLTIDENNKGIDRGFLYKLKDKKDDNIIFSDIQLSGAIQFVDNNRNSLYSYNNSLYTITGTTNILNNSLPNFDKQIIPTKGGKFNNIEIIFNDNLKYIISDIISVTRNTILAKSVQINSFGVLSFLPKVPFNTTILNDNVVNTNNIFAIYKEGGQNYFSSILEQISFFGLMDKINSANPEINYITIREDGTEIKNDFLLFLEQPSSNTKLDTLTTSNVLDNSSANLGFGVLGKEFTNLRNKYLNLMFRYNGNYNFKTKDVLFYRNGINFTNTFNEDLRKNLLFKNIEFFSTYKDFGIYKNLYINKINDINPNKVLQPITGKEQVYWKTSNISLDKTDMYIFRSSWDLNFYRKYSNKNSFTNLPGYVYPKEVSNFMGSVAMNIPDELTFNNFNENYYSIVRNDLVNVTINLNIEKLLIDTIKPKLEYLYQEYVSNELNYGIKETFNDDIEFYIKSNILDRYKNGTIEVYIKYNSLEQNSNIIESNMNRQTLIQNGFIRLDTVLVKLLDNNFDRQIIFNKPSDKGVQLAFIQKIEVI